MMRRTLYTLVTGLAAIALATSCTPPEDPTADGGNGATPDDATVDDSGNGGGSGNGTDTGDEDDAGDDTGGGTGTDADAGGTDEDGGTSGDDAGGGTNFQHTGGNAVNDTPSNVLESGTGLQSVMDRFDTIIEGSDHGESGSWPTDSDGNGQTVELDDPIEISGAVVTSTANDADGQLHFWIQDADAAIEVFIEDRLFPRPPEPFEEPVIKVGQKLTLTATALKSYNGIPEITNIEIPPTVDSSGNDVPYQTIDSSSALTDDKFANIIKVSGKLTNKKTGENCSGAQQCLDLEYDGSGSTMPFRVPVKNDAFPTSVDQCITYVGPLDRWAGPLKGDGTLQINLDNFNWATDQYAPSDGSCEFNNPDWTGQIFSDSGGE